MGEFQEEHDEEYTQHCRDDDIAGRHEKHGEYEDTPSDGVVEQAFVVLSQFIEYKPSPEVEYNHHDSDEILAVPEFINIHYDGIEYVHYVSAEPIYKGHIFETRGGVSLLQTMISFISLRPFPFDVVVSDVFHMFPLLVCASP